MKINLKKVFPSELSSYVGYRIVRITTALYLMVMIGRSSIHLFSSDGGANGIAATAQLAGLVVLHNDKDFDLIAKITGQVVEKLKLPR